MSVHPLNALNGGVDGVKAPAGAAATRPAPGAGNFADVLKTRLHETQKPLANEAGSLKLSSHAMQRIERREIEFDGPVAARLEAAVDRAAAKGSRESLVLVDSTAFVVSVRNRTVITAVPVSPQNDQVFTNVDSAVIG